VLHPHRGLRHTTIPEDVETSGGEEEAAAEEATEIMHGAGDQAKAKEAEAATVEAEAEATAVEAEAEATAVEATVAAEEEDLAILELRVLTLLLNALNAAQQAT
jgi:hypothetical protein